VQFHLLDFANLENSDVFQITKSDAVDNTLKIWLKSTEMRYNLVGDFTYGAIAVYDNFLTLILVRTDIN